MVYDKRQDSENGIKKALQYSMIAPTLAYANKTRMCHVC